VSVPFTGDFRGVTGVVGVASLLGTSMVLGDPTVVGERLSVLVDRAKGAGVDGVAGVSTLDSVDGVAGEIGLSIRRASGFETGVDTLLPLTPPRRSPFAFIFRGVEYGGGWNICRR